MGLFSFLKKAGDKILGGGDDEKTTVSEDLEAANIRKANLLKDIVSSTGIEIEDLNISIADDVVTISGEAPSQADKEKVILALGNIDGISAVDDRMTAKKEEPAATFYEVKSGDSLSKIAKAHYGDAMKYMEIFEANKPMLSDPNKIYPGQQLRIPVLD